MKILAISDEECPAFYEHYIPGRLAEYDLIISCGDLNPKYLSFIVTMARVPVLYVHGNHDDRYDRIPPEGCDCIDDQLIVDTIAALRGNAVVAGIVVAVDIQNRHSCHSHDKGQVLGIQVAAGNDQVIIRQPAGNVIIIQRRTFFVCNSQYFHYTSSFSGGI